MSYAWCSEIKTGDVIYIQKTCKFGTVYLNYTPGLLRLSYISEDDGEYYQIHYSDIGCVVENDTPYERMLIQLKYS